MTQPTEILEALKEAGVRLTPQRLMVLQTIAEGEGHLGVDEIYRRVKNVYPYMDIATVYRTLHLFKKLHLVTEVGLGDRLHYELALGGRKHHHMVCQQCNGTFDLSPSYLEEFRQTLRQDFGFEPDLEHFTVTGTCARCTSKVTETS
ncbi:MAG: Fur family transcriptional regulator [Dehalococcoidia bacterium]